MIALTECDEADHCQNQCHQFRCHDRQPDSVQSPNHWQNQHCYDLAHQGAHKGDRRRNKPIIECGKHGASEDVKAAQQKRKRIDYKAVPEKDSFIVLKDI